MTEAIPTYEIGDTLVIEVPVEKGRYGPVVKVEDITFVVPGHSDYDANVKNIHKHIVSVKKPLRVGDKVEPKSGVPKISGLIYAFNDRGNAMVGWDGNNVVWYEWPLEDLVRID